MFEAIVGLAGLGMQLFGGFGAASEAARQAHDMEEAAYQGRLADWAKLQQMNLDAERKRRDIVRKSIAARSMALTAATSNGENINDSSVLEGAFGGIQNTTVNDTLALNQNVMTAKAITAYNNKANEFYADAGQAKGAQARDLALSSLGGAIMGSAGQISRVGSFLGGRLSNIGSLDLSSGIY